MIKVVCATPGKGVPVSMASGAVRAVLRSNVIISVSVVRIENDFSHKYVIVFLCV